MTGSLRHCLTLTIAASLMLASGGVGLAEAQTPRHVSAQGSDWGYFLYETGAAAVTVITGQPAFAEAQPEAVITIVSRNGRALAEGDRAAAIPVAQALCQQGGRQFNTQTRGHWLTNGGLSFDGACTRW